MLEVQRNLYHHGGAINKLLVDDKGLLFLAAFGVPKAYHADDPARAVGAALDLAEHISVSRWGGVLTLARVFGVMWGHWRESLGWCGDIGVSLWGDVGTLA